jgi:hypothetical protein
MEEWVEGKSSMPVEIIGIGAPRHWVVKGG